MKRTSALEKSRAFLCLSSERGTLSKPRRAVLPSIVMNKKTALWFGRNPPTEPQVEEAYQMGYKIVEVHRGRRLARRPLRTHVDLVVLKDRLQHLAGEHTTNTLFGVFPPPAVEALKDFRLFAPWSVNDDGVYMHRRWCEVSYASPALSIC